MDFNEFCKEKQSEKFYLHRDSWRKLMRKLAIERRHEKRLANELESAGYGKPAFSSPTDLKLKIMLLEDFRNAMRGELVAQRVGLHVALTDLEDTVREAHLKYLNQQHENRQSKFNADLQSSMLSYEERKLVEKIHQKHRLFPLHPTTWLKPSLEMYCNIFYYMLALGVVKRVIRLPSVRIVGQDVSPK